MVEAPDHVEVLEAGEVLVDRRVLAGEADLAAQCLGVLEHVEAGDASAAAVGLQQRGEDAHRGRLAGAVGPEQAEHRARLRAQVDAAQRVHLAVGLLQPFRDDRRLRHRRLTLAKASRPFGTVWHTLRVPVRFLAALSVVAALVVAGPPRRRNRPRCAPTAAVISGDLGRVASVKASGDDATSRSIPANTPDGIVLGDGFVSVTTSVIGQRVRPGRGRRCRVARRRRDGRARLRAPPRTPAAA